MFARIAADGILLLHLLFILFALFGGLAVLYRRRVIWLHLPTVLWSSLVNLAGWTCPLTPLENRFRLMAGQSGYSGGFILHYIEPVVYPAGMPRNFELTAGVSVVIWNILVYLFLLYPKLRGERK